MIVKIVKLIVFFIITIVMIIWGGGISLSQDAEYSQSVDRIYAFHKQPKDTIDVVLVGASSVYRGWSSMDAYNNYGFTSWAWSTSSQPFIATKYIIKDVQRNQSPSLYVINYSNMRRGSTKYQEGFIREVTDSLLFSFNRQQAIQALMPYRAEDNINLLYYTFPFLRFHGNWEFFMNGILTPKDTNTMGTLVQPLSFETTFEDTYYQGSATDDPLDPSMQKEINDLLSWVNKENIPVLFVLYPRVLSEKDNSRFNTIEALFDEYGIAYLNLAKEIDKIGLDGAKDFQDEAHLNYWGRMKVTDYISEYIRNNYIISDHRGDPAYAAWDEAYQNYTSLVDKYLSES